MKQWFLFLAVMPKHNNGFIISIRFLAFSIVSVSNNSPKRIQSPFDNLLFERRLGHFSCFTFRSPASMLFFLVIICRILSFISLSCHFAGNSSAHVSHPRYRGGTLLLAVFFFSRIRERHVIQQA